MSERKSELYLEDILESIEAIKSYIDGIDYETFCQSRMIYAAAIREFTIIGEAISKLIDLLSEVHPEYPWRSIKDFRNFIIHEYFGVDPGIVWDAITLELDELQTIIENIKKDSKLLTSKF